MDKPCTNGAPEQNEPSLREDFATLIRMLDEDDLAFSEHGEDQYFVFGSVKQYEKVIKELQEIRQTILPPTCEKCSADDQ